jgi:glycosyltransferase involved in cell wall biosynthesis
VVDPAPSRLTYDLDRAHRILRPGITVCIATHPARFRGPRLLNRALASVVAQTMLPTAIHVVNDVDRHGAGATRRTLLDHVDTEWLAWIDSDDEWMPEHLEKLFRVAIETDSIYVFSWFHGGDPLGHFGLPFNPCSAHHTTMNVLVRTDIAREVGFPDNAIGPHANEDWAFIKGVAKLACERGLKMTHLAEKTWTYHQGHGNTSGQPGQGDAR